MPNFTNLQERIEARASAITKALQREMMMLEQVEKTLNTRYNESVLNVLNSLRSNTETLENELISEKMKQVSKQIERKSNEILEDWVKDMLNTQKSLTEVRRQMVEEEQKTLKKMQKHSKEISEGIEKQKKQLHKITIKTAIIPAVVFIAFLGGIGTAWYFTPTQPIPIQPTITPKPKEISYEEVKAWIDQRYSMRKTENGFILEKKGY